MKTENEVTPRVILRQPTAGVDFALQKGHGGDYQLVQKQRSSGKDLTFEFSVGAKPGRDAETPGFAGPFVQGPTGDKFFYLDIGTYAGQSNTPWSRRLKIPLSGISWKMIKAGQALEAEIPGTDKDGGPSCAYEWRRRVSPDWGWKVVRRSGK